MEEEPILEGLVNMADGGGKTGSHVDSEASLYCFLMEQVSSLVGSWKKAKFPLISLIPNVSGSLLGIELSPPTLPTRERSFDKGLHCNEILTR